MLPPPAPNRVDLAIYGVSHPPTGPAITGPARLEPFWPGCRPGSGHAQLGPCYHSLTRYTKTAKLEIQAKSRKHPEVPARPGRDARREFEYVRHGTISLIAAMNVTTGEVIAERITRNDSATFTAFLTMLDQSIPPHLRIHLIMDNGSSHTSRATHAWLQAHPRISVTYTPKHASWLNMIEIWNGIITRQLIRRGTHTSVKTLIADIEQFVAHWNSYCKPVVWTVTGDEIIDKVRIITAQMDRLLGATEITDVVREVA